MESPSPDALSTDSGVIRELREILDSAGYSAGTIGELLHIRGELRISTGDRTRARFLLDDSRPLDVLVRLFLLGGAVGTAALRTALGGGADVLRRAGLLRRDGDGECGTCLLVPHDGLIVASDPFGAADRWWVPGVQRPSDLLACVTPRHAVARALDLGTGNGIQALLLARHAERVVAVDVNRHALQLAAFNVALNGCAGVVELREGDFVDPVAGEGFDLVVSNPPYVLSPERSYVFRDADVRGDVMCRRLLRAIVGCLADDGLGVMMVSWADHGDAAAPPLDWLDEAAADGVLMVLDVHSALDAAMLWNAPHVVEPDDFARRVDAWRAYFAAEDIPSIGHGVVAMRRSPDGRRSVSLALPASAPPGPRGGAQLQRVLDGVTAIERGARPATLVIADDAQLVETVRTAGGHETRSADLTVPGGLSFSVGLDAAGAGLVRRFTTPIGVQDALASFGDLDPDGRARATSFLDDLVRLGLLAIAGDAP